MSCGFSREMLALHAEGDLPDVATATTVSHLASCEDCRQFLEDLHASQALLKSIRRETASPSDCTAMRREVMTIINEPRHALGWALRIERAIALGFRPSYAMAALAMFGVLSMSVLAQMRPFTHARSLEGADTLLRPVGYQGWIPIADGVYINPSSYREYAKTSRFPDGTVLVWEQATPGKRSAGGPHDASSTLLVSLKDRTRFASGWAFFDFSSSGGGAPEKARALPESSGCRTCHRDGPLTEIRQVPGKRA